MESVEEEASESLDSAGFNILLDFFDRNILRDLPDDDDEEKDELLLELSLELELLLLLLLLLLELLELRVRCFFGGETRYMLLLVGLTISLLPLGFLFCLGIFVRDDDRSAIRLEVTLDPLRCSFEQLLVDSRLGCCAFKHSVEM